MSKPVLQVVIASTRPGRAGRVIGEWFYERAVAGDASTSSWSTWPRSACPSWTSRTTPGSSSTSTRTPRSGAPLVERGDAYVFVTPEYNHSFNAVLKNALDYLHQEWQHKAAGFVSYGGLSGGTRAVNSLRQVVSTLKMIPVVEAVNLPFYRSSCEDGTVKPNDVMTGAADAMLAELAKLTGALRPMRLSAA